MERGGKLVGTHNSEPMGGGGAGGGMKLSVTSHETIKCHRCSRLATLLHLSTAA
jgi:hypothetical protein